MTNMGDRPCRLWETTASAAATVGFWESRFRMHIEKKRAQEPTTLPSRPAGESGRLLTTLSSLTYPSTPSLPRRYRCTIVVHRLVTDEFGGGTGDIGELCWHIHNAKSKTERSAFNSAAANVTKLKFMAHSNNHLSAQTKGLRDVLLYTKSPAKSTTAVRDKGADGRMMKKRVITVKEFTAAEETRKQHQQSGGPLSSFPDAHEIIRPNMSLSEVRALSGAARKRIDVEEEIERGLEAMSDHLRTALTAKMNANPRNRQGRKETAYYRNIIREENKMAAVKVRPTAKHLPPRTSLTRTRSHLKTVQIDGGEKN